MCAGNVPAAEKGKVGLEIELQGCMPSRKHKNHNSSCTHLMFIEATYKQIMTWHRSSTEEHLCHPAVVVLEMVWCGFVAENMHEE